MNEQQARARARAFRRRELSSPVSVHSGLSVRFRDRHHAKAHTGDRKRNTRLQSTNDIKRDPSEGDASENKKDIDKVSKSDSSTDSKVEIATQDTHKVKIEEEEEG